MQAGTTNDMASDGPSYDAGQLAVRGGRRWTARWPTAVVVVCHLVLALGITWAWWTPLGRRISAINTTDATLFSWLLTSTPYSVAAGQFPLFSDRMNFPAGINLMWNNGMVLPGLVFAPVTSLFGGVATVTVLTALGMAGSATSAYVALRSLPVTGAPGGSATPMGVLPAALGGTLFGFSPAMSAQALGHPNLVFNLLVPVLLLLSARLLIEPDPPRRAAVLLGVTAGAQLLIGEEMLFLSGIVVVLLGLVLAVGNPRDARQRARLLVDRAAVALAAFLLVAAVPLGFQLFGPLPQHRSPFDTAYYSTDLAGFVLPSGRQALTTDGAARQVELFAGGPEEHTAYLGYPLLLLAVTVLIVYRHRAAVRVPLLLALITAVFALGPELTVLTRKTGVRLPWALLDGLPGFEHVIVTRFALLTAGLVGVGLAVALDDVLRRRPTVRAAALITAAGALLPLLPAPLPGMPTPEVPAFFATHAAADLACPGGSALVLPFPRAGTTEPMLWQQAAGMSFAMPGGYFIGPGPDGRAYVHGTPTRTAALFAEVLRDGRAQLVTPELRSAVAADLARWKVCAVVLGPTRSGEALRAQATSLIGREPEEVEGVFLWRDVSLTS